MKISRGFTLIELMVVVLIIGIIAAVAIPSFTSQVRKSRRAEAQSKLQQIALLQERFRADNPSYTDAWANLGGDPNSNSDFGTYYSWSVTVAAGPPATFTLTATAKGAQSGDVSEGTACSPLTLTNAGTKSPAICWN